MSKKDIFPKIIWFSWLQGKEDMPLLTQYCLKSWEALNPNWKINFVTLKNLGEFVDLGFFPEDCDVKKNLTGLSEVLRLNILNKYGGVWVDATSFCAKPLDEWLQKYLETGFFAFSHPKKKGIVAKWFLASTPGNYIMRKWCEAENDYWKKNPKMELCNTSRPKLFLARILSVIAELFSRNRDYWFHPFFSKTLSVRPYFYSYYIFENLYKKDKKFKEMHDSSSGKELCASLGTFLQKKGINNKLSPAVRTFLDLERFPVYKLNYRTKIDFDEKDSNIFYLLRKFKVF